MQATAHVLLRKDTPTAPILDLPVETLELLSPEDKEGLTIFQRCARRYQQRIAWPLSEDLYLHGLRDFFEEHEIRYARVPLSSIDTVYYLFRDFESLRLFMSFTERTPETVIN